MTRAATVLVALILSAGLPAQTQPAASPEVLLKAAMQKEQVDGDRAAALVQYQVIVDRFPGHSVAARALFQMAGIHERQGDRDIARDLYQQIISRHPESAAAARAKMSTAGLPASALVRTQISPLPLELGDFVRASPDGRWLSFDDNGSGDLGIWRIGSGETRLLTRNGRDGEGSAMTSVWSRDSRQLAYRWQAERERPQTTVSELRVVARDGGTPRTLLTDSPEVRKQLGFTRTMWIEPFDWSPNHTWVLVGLGESSGPGVVGHTRLARVSMINGPVTTIVQLGTRGTPDRATVSPDGAWIAYDYLSAAASADRDVFVVSTSGSTPQAVVADSASIDRVIGWMPDGKHLLYTSTALGTVDAWALPMRAGQPNGTAFRLQSDVGGFDHRGLTADGRFFAEHLQNRTDVFVADIDPNTGRFTRAPRPLPRAQQGTRHQGTWSPDGTRIAYFHVTPMGAKTLVVQVVSTNAVRSYPLAVENPERPVWHPDGRAIAFNAVGDTAPQELFLLDLDSGKVQSIAASQQVAFSSDGRYLYYPRRAAMNAGASRAPGSLVRRRLADGIEDAVFSGCCPAIALALSPDGKTFASFVRPSEEDERLSVVVFPAEGGSPRVVVEQYPRLSNEVAWSPDGKWLYLSTSPGKLDRSDAAIWRVPAAGGTIEKVGATPWPGWLKHLSVAPDGRLAMSLVGGDTELWTWDNLPALVSRGGGR